MASFNTVLSLHGIKTRGLWQKNLDSLLADDGFIPKALDYGSFPAFKFLVPGLRRNKTRWLLDEYERIQETQPNVFPSIIAHSFGSYLVGELLDKYPQAKFDKVILCGSILPVDYDWPTLLEKGRIGLLRNDYGELDMWPRVAKTFVTGTGASGSDNFEKKHPLMITRGFPRYGHSDYFNQLHFRNEWIPTLKTTVIRSPDLGIVAVTMEKQHQLLEYLDMARQTVSGRLGVPLTVLRANIFLRGMDDRLTIPYGLHDNMQNSEELTISIPIGAGCTGKAFKLGKIAIAVYKKDWGDYVLPKGELAKVDRKLRWVISTPIPDPEKPGILGVFCVDCLEMEKQYDDLEPLGNDLRAVAQTLGTAMKITVGANTR